MEPSRRELKIPLRVLCLLSDKIESRGPPGLRAQLTINSYLRRCTNENQWEKMQSLRDRSLSKYQIEVTEHV